jgi:hypothetical protein
MCGYAKNKKTEGGCKKHFLHLAKKPSVLHKYKTDLSEVKSEWRSCKRCLSFTKLLTIVTVLLLSLVTKFCESMVTMLSNPVGNGYL